MPRTVALAAAAALLALAPLAAVAQSGPGRPQAPPPALPAAGDTLPLDPRVRSGVLDNGLRYYVRANGRPEKRAELRLVVNAGSILEDDDQRGLAHFVEHMAFNGSRHFAKNELVAYLESIGMRFGADLNASTSFDETVYTLTLPTDSAAALAKGLLILEDWAHGLTFDHGEIQRERGVVTEEWRLGQGAGSRVRDRQLPVIFSGSRYASRLPIGTKGSLDSASDAALVRFYREWYRPNLMAVIAVGDFDADRMVADIKSRFAALANPPASRPRALAPVPDHDSTLVSIATDPEITYNSVAVAWLLPPGERGTERAYRQSLVEALYNGMLNERFSDISQRPGAPFIRASSGKSQLVRSKDLYQLGALVQDGGIERGLEAILTEAERVDAHGFTAGELDRARANMLRGYERAFAEREKTYSASLADEYVDNFLNGTPAPGIAYEYELARRLLPTVTLDEVNRLGRDWISERNRVVLVTAPQKSGAPVPDRAAILALLDGVRRRPVAAYVDSASRAPLLDAVPKPGRITSERRIAAVGVTEWRLSNGARVLVKPTDFQADQLVMRAYSPGGTSLVADSDYVSAATATVVVTEGGVGRLTLPDLRKRLAGKAVNVTPSLSDAEEGMTASASPRDLETMLQLTYLYFTAPRADSAAFAALRERVRAALANRGASPEAAFRDTLQVTLAQHHFRSRPFSAAMVDEMRLDRSLAIYRDRFADAGDFTFVFVGNVALDSLRPLVRRYLASLPSTRRRERPRDPGVATPAGIVERIVRRGTEPKAETAIVFSGPFEFSRANRFALGALADVLNTQLRESLREQLGGTYGVSVSAEGERDPRQRYALSIEFGSAPERQEALTRALFAQLDTLERSGPSAFTVAKVKEAGVRARETSLRQNGYWLSQIVTFDRLGWPLAEIPAGDRLIAALDARTVQKAARLYLNERRYVKVVLLPESGPPNAPGTR